MFKKILLGLFSFSLFFSLSSAILAASFSDVSKTHPYFIAINYLGSEKIVQGYEQNLFKPNQLITRAEALKIIFEGNKIVIPNNLSGENFSDVKNSDWFWKYVLQAKNQKIVNGNADGTFAPGRNVTRAEFVKMLLASNNFKPEKWLNQNLFNDVPTGLWFEAYLNYAGAAGLITQDASGNVHPNKEITRGEVAEIFYLLKVIQNGKNTDFLLTQAQAQIDQIEIYLVAKNNQAGKHSSQLAVDMTQQVYKIMPQDKTILGKAKIARAYDFLVNSYISEAVKKHDESKDWANQAIQKATEAWQADPKTQPTAHHIKELANKILALVQVGA